MIKQNLLFILIGIIIFFSTVDCTSTACENNTITDCQTCMDAGDCAFCTKDNKCFPSGTTQLLNSQCSTSELKVKTCVGRLIIDI